MEIQTAVHKIYQQLSVTLERALQANKHHIGKHMLSTLQQITFKGFLNKVSPKIVTKTVYCFYPKKIIAYFNNAHIYTLVLCTIKCLLSLILYYYYH